MSAAPRTQDNDPYGYRSWEFNDHQRVVHDWDVGHGSDGWGVILGVSKCHTCGRIACAEDLEGACDGQA